MTIVNSSGRITCESTMDHLQCEFDTFLWHHMDWTFDGRDGVCNCVLIQRYLMMLLRTFCKIDDGDDDMKRNIVKTISCVVHTCFCLILNLTR